MIAARLLAALDRAPAGERPGLCRAGAVCGRRAGLSRQRQRPGLCRRAVLQHRLGDRPVDQQEPRRHSPRRSAADEPVAALQGPGPRPRARLLAGPQDAGGGLDRLELGDVRRYRHQPREAHDLRRALAARGVLHAGRQRGLGHGARRGLRRGARRRRPIAEKSAHHGAERTGHDDLLSRRPLRLCVLQLHAGNRRDRHADPRDRRAREAGLAVLPQHRRLSRRRAGLADPEGCRAR